MQFVDLAVEDSDHTLLACVETVIGRGDLLRKGQHRLLLALEHAEIDVVVPPNELPLAHRSEQGPVVQPVDDSVARQQVAREPHQLQQMLGAAFGPHRVLPPVREVAGAGRPRARPTCRVAHALRELEPGIGQPMNEPSRP